MVLSVKEVFQQQEQRSLYNLDMLYDLLQVIRDLKCGVMPLEMIYRRRTLNVKNRPMADFCPRYNGPMSPGRRMRDGQRGRPTFEAYGCITSASEMGKLFGTLSKEKMHARILYLAERGLLEFETYTPKYNKANMKLKPYWYTRLEVTDLGLRFMELYEKMNELMMILIVEEDDDDDDEK